MGPQVGPHMQRNHDLRGLMLFTHWLIRCDLWSQVLKAVFYFDLIDDRSQQIRL